VTLRQFSAAAEGCGVALTGTAASLSTVCMSESEPPWLALAARMMEQTPFTAGLGVEIVELDRGKAKTRLPFGPELVGDPETGVVHGGVVTGLLDHTCGMAVMSALRSPMPIATLDLRIDYMKPAAPGQAIVAEVRCLKVTHEIAFVRGSAHQGDPDDPVALCTGTFMLMHMTAPIASPE
jgi:uncharacterized protein (TIGR00369 family)